MVMQDRLFFEKKLLNDRNPVIPHMFYPEKPFYNKTKQIPQPEDGPGVARQKIGDFVQNAYPMTG